VSAAARKAGAAPKKRDAARAGTHHSLTLSLQFADATDRALLPRRRVRRWLEAALERPAEVTVRIVGAEEGAALNREFRGKDKPTNVLTFDYAREPVVVADLVLCAPVLREEAAAAGIDLDAHYAHLVVHGALHAQGLDHEDEAEAAAMEARESAVLIGLGYPDPYPG
jgi:probable rRNA maturation factor